MVIRSKEAIPHRVINMYPTLLCVCLDVFSAQLLETFNLELYLGSTPPTSKCTLTPSTSSLGQTLTDDDSYTACCPPRPEVHPVSRVAAACVPRTAAHTTRKPAALGLASLQPYPETAGLAPDDDTGHDDAALRQHFWEVLPLTGSHTQCHLLAPAPILRIRCPHEVWCDDDTLQLAGSIASEPDDCNLVRPAPEHEHPLANVRGADFADFVQSVDSFSGADTLVLPDGAMSLGGVPPSAGDLDAASGSVPLSDAPPGGEPDGLSPSSGLCHDAAVPAEGGGPLDIDIFDIDMSDFVVDTSLSMLAVRGSFIRTFMSRVTRW